MGVAGSEVVAADSEAADGDDKRVPHAIESRGGVADRRSSVRSLSRTPTPGTRSATQSPFDDLFRSTLVEQARPQARVGRRIENDEVAAALRRAHGKPVNLTTRARRGATERPIDLDVSFKRRLRASIRQVFAPYRSMWRYRR